MGVITARGNNKRWTDPQAWNTGTVPCQADDVLIPKGISPPPCQPGEANCYSITTDVTVLPQPRKRGRKQ